MRRLGGMRGGSVVDMGMGTGVAMVVPMCMPVAVGMAVGMVVMVGMRRDGNHAKDVIL